ncbi:MAG: YdeI/OmpD-associated family protein [Ignavibacteria bacterium]
MRAQDYISPEIAEFFDIGCGRCSLVGTPKCKVKTRNEELHELREIILMNDITEERKWGVPCYTDNGKNIILLSALKDSATLSFLKGSLIDDVHGLLIAPGKNSQSARYMKFTSVKEINKAKPIIVDYIKQAIEIERTGKKVSFKKEDDPIPEELSLAFKKQPELKTAFYALTPGRRRGYLLHFNQAKQSVTRESRIQQCIPLILQGKGLQ